MNRHTHQFYRCDVYPDAPLPALANAAATPVASTYRQELCPTYHAGSSPTRKGKGPFQELSSQGHMPGSCADRIPRAAAVIRSPQPGFRQRCFPCDVLQRWVGRSQAGWHTLLDRLDNRNPVTERQAPTQLAPVPTAWHHMTAATALPPQLLPPLECIYHMPACRQGRTAVHLVSVHRVLSFF